MPVTPCSASLGGSAALARQAQADAFGIPRCNPAAPGPQASGCHPLARPGCGAADAPLHFPLRLSAPLLALSTARRRRPAQRIVHPRCKVVYFRTVGKFSPVFPCAFPGHMQRSIRDLSSSFDDWVFGNVENAVD
eukprot:5501800-Pyramimonas_sp.AAC.1